ncbi:MAG TPA: hypothetical protein DCE27_14575 [Xanthomarina gelatinilytica]|nr:hypothetical protein [Xanthomarina gelatinilytica]
MKKVIQLLGLFIELLEPCTNDVIYKKMNPFGINQKKPVLKNWVSLYNTIGNFRLRFYTFSYYSLFSMLL